MRKIIVINSGSSSLKFKLFESPSKNVLASGLIERIGLDDSIITIKYGDKKKHREVQAIKDHTVAVDLLLQLLKKLDIVTDLNEISAVGHRVVAGGEYFKKSVPVDGNVIKKIEDIIELAPFLGLIGTVIGIWMTFKALGVTPNPSAMAEGIYVALTTTIAGLFVAIVLLPLHTYIQGLVENEMDKIELATKMTNWGYAVVKVRVEANVECALEALQEAEGVVNTRLISDPYANIKVSFKPSMLDKSISNIILEKCNVNAEIIESKLRQ